MKPYSRLDDFLKNNNQKFSVTNHSNQLAISANNAQANYNSRIDELKKSFENSKKIIESTSNKRTVYRQINNFNDIKKVLTKVIEFDKYFVFGKFDTKIEKDRKLIESSIDKVEDLIIYSYLGMFDTIDYNEDLTKITAEYISNVIIEEYNRESFKNFIKTLNQLADLNEDDKYHFIINNNGNKIIFAGHYNKAEQDGHFVVSIIDQQFQVSESAIIVIDKNEMFVGIDMIYAKKPYLAKKYIDRIYGIGTQVCKEGRDIPVIVFMIRMMYIFGKICERALSLEKFKFGLSESSQFELSWIHQILASRTKPTDQSVIIKIPIICDNKAIGDINRLEPDEIKKIVERTYTEDFLTRYFHGDADSLSKYFYEFANHKDDFTEFELDGPDFKKILNYVEKNYIKMNKSINFKEVLDNQRYGQKIKLNLFEKDDEYLYIIPEFDTNTNKLYFHLYFMNKNYNFMFVAVFSNADKFFFGGLTPLDHVEMFVAIDRNAVLVPSRKELNDILPPKMDEASTIVSIISMILSLYIITHDRPERLCTARKEYMPIHKNNVPKLKYDSKYVIKHIVAYKSTIMKKIKDKPTTSGFERQVEYVMENWDRIGHLRTYKSGKSVWINPVTCHRHKDLTTKQIKVKY